MKKLFLFLLVSIFNNLLVHAQNSYEPQLLILTPNEFSFEPGLQKEVNSANVKLKKMSKEAVSSLFGDPDKASSLPTNLKLMQQNDMSFLDHMEISKELPFVAQGFLIYRFYERFPNCLVLLSQETSPRSIDNLHRIAAEQKQPYILNFSKAFLYTENGIKFCKILVQLYEQQSNTLLIDKEYKGDWNNPGFEFTCDQGSIGCTINNALSFALADVISQMAQHNQTLIKERELAKMRSAYIAQAIYPQPLHDDIIRTAIPPGDTDVDLKDLYHCFYDTDKTKFVAFFIKKVAGKDPKSIFTEKKDGNIKVITKKDVKSPGYFDQPEDNYAYIVRGVKYQNKWYIDKSEVTYFDAPTLEEGKLEYLNNLQQWDFFNENTAEPGVGFWDGKLFEKVKDKKNDPNWGKYKDLWATEEREDRDYLGLYTIVANNLKKEKELADGEFRKRVADGLMLLFYTKQLKLKTNGFIKADTAEVYNMIYPKDGRVVLNALRVTDQKGVTRIRYFIFLVKTNEVFEWKLVTPNVVKKDDFTNESVIKTIGALTRWDYSFKTLDDDNFWNEKVLAKEGAGYKYLKKLQ